MNYTEWFLYHLQVLSGIDNNKTLAELEPSDIEFVLKSAGLDFSRPVKENKPSTEEDSTVSAENS